MLTKPVTRGEGFKLIVSFSKSLPTLEGDSSLHRGTKLMSELKAWSNHARCCFFSDFVVITWHQLHVWELSAT